MSDNYIYDDAAVLNRKFAKTCVEKKRRDRINRCLDELKDLMSQADDKAKYQKMEKAEILEMAVTYMKTLRSTNSNHSETSNSSTGAESSGQYYQLAFRQCLNEFQNYLQLFPGIKDDFKARIMSHMSQRYVEMMNGATANLPGASGGEGSKVRKSSSFKKARYSPYSTTSSPSKSNIEYMSIITSSDSSSASNSFNYQPDASIHQQSHSPALSTSDMHNKSSCSSYSSGSSSPSLSQCSSPKNVLNCSNDDSVWRPWWISFAIILLHNQPNKQWANESKYLHSFS